MVDDGSYILKFYWVWGLREYFVFIPHLPLSYGTYYQ